MTTVQITLPDALAQEATEAGLLAPETIEQILREQLRAGRIADLQRMRQTLAADPLPEMTSEEIGSDIAAYRAEHRRASGS